MSQSEPSAVGAPAALHGENHGLTRRNVDEIRLIVVLAVCAALVFVNRGGIAFLFPMIKPELHLSNTQLGQLMSATSLAWALSSVCTSLASDLLGIRPRTLIVICALGFSIVGALAGAVSTFPALLALRAAMGLFEGPVIPLIQATITTASPAKRRGANLGLIIGGSGLVGSVLAPPLMTGLASTLGWRFAFLAIAAPGPFVALAVWFVMRPGGPAGTIAVVARLDLRPALRLAARRNILLGAIGAISLIGSAIALISFLPLYLASLPAFSTGDRMAFFIGLGVTTHIGGIVLSALSDRLGRRACLVAACLCSTAAPIAVALLSVSAWWVIPAILLHFVAGGALTLMVYVVPGETVPPKMAASTFAALLFVGEIIGGATAPTLAGWVADRHGLASAQLVCSALAAVALLAALFVQEAVPTAMQPEGQRDPPPALPESAI